MARFEAKTAVVTGASSGIGKATAARLLTEGARVVVVSDRSYELHDAAAELSEHGDVVSVVCDVSDPGQVSDLSRRTEALGGVDVLVNNAGVWSERSFTDIDMESWDHTIRVNLTGPFLCSRAFVPQLARERKGVVVNTASTNGLVAEPRLAHYNASKGGLVMLTRSMAVDLSPMGVRVNAVAPGVIRTPLIADILDEQPVGHFGGIPIGRVGQPEEIAACIAFLASEDASYVTGHVLVCDGGQLAVNGDTSEPA